MNSLEEQELVYRGCACSRNGAKTIQSNLVERYYQLSLENMELLSTPRQFRAKIQYWDEMEDKEDYPVANEDGWVTGWYADGIMVGKAIECNEDGVVFDWWTWVDPESVEAV